MTDEQKAREQQPEGQEEHDQDNQEPVEEEMELLEDEEPVDESEENLEIHPADRVMDCVREIVNQEKRLTTKNAGSVKYELVNNIYPLLKTAFSAMIDFIDATESESEQEEVDEQIRVAVEENVKIAVDNCKKLVKLNEEFGEPILEILSDTGKEDYQSIVEWAKSSVETTQHQH